MLLLNPLAPLIEGLERCVVYQAMPNLFGFRTVP